ncbi:MAG: type II secretion system GspH family protein [Sulfurovum sp.]|nr:type II secretion system GspH family protein [Sulfurovum sp.]
MKRPAFTMLELVFVIVVLGILASLAMPRIDRDLKQEAADNVLSAIRYTQHLALTDNKHKYNEKDWLKSLWQIRFENDSGFAYIIASNSDLDANLDEDEAALDPANGKLFYNDGDHASPNVFIEKLYGIDTVTFNDCAGTSASNAKHIAFDNLGRPHRGVFAATYDYKTYVKNKDCQITFSSDAFDSDFTIQINRETGYAFIVGQESS